MAGARRLAAVAAVGRAPLGPVQGVPQAGEARDMRQRRQAALPQPARQRQAQRLRRQVAHIGLRVRGPRLWILRTLVGSLLDFKEPFETPVGFLRGRMEIRFEFRGP